MTRPYRRRTPEERAAEEQLWRERREAARAAAKKSASARQALDRKRDLSVREIIKSENPGKGDALPVQARSTPVLGHPNFGPDFRIFRSGDRIMTDSGDLLL